MATSPWFGIKWIALGLLALLIGFVWSWVAERQFRFWLYADHYVAAELEVTRFDSKPRNSAARCRIEGVIHPGGELVVTTDRDIAIKQFEMTTRATSASITARTTSPAHPARQPGLV